jgi:hypothetical protein
MVRSVLKEKAACIRGLWKAHRVAMAMQQEKERKMATPSRRGRGLECK